MKRLLGLEPVDGVRPDGSMKYSMGKSPVGFVDILYVDDELRVSRGNRGSIVVAERVVEA